MIWNHAGLRRVGGERQTGSLNWADLCFMLDLLLGVSTPKLLFSPVAASGGQQAGDETITLEAERL